ncbi:MAG: hypothetical protein K2X82_30155 [Gemmataceae bacterium]|nr:hypothetical protein [Gemmataceae bacterium]
MMGWGKGFLTEGAKIVLAFAPKDQTGAATSSLWIKLADFKRLTWLIVVGDRAGATTPAVALNQAKTNAGGSSKALAFDVVAVSGVQAQTVNTDTLTPAAVASDTFNMTAADATLYAINVRADMLDINNGFKYVQLTIATPGANAFPVAVIGIAYDGTWSAKEASLPSVVG